MRAPANKRDDDEIVAEIVRLVEPSVELLIRRRISDLREMLSPFTGNRSENQKYMTGLRRQVTDLQDTLAKPQSFLLKLRFWSLWGLQGTAFEANPQTRKWIALERAPLTQELNWLLALCDEIIYEPGEHAHTDSQKIFAAVDAAEVLEASAMHAGQPFQLHYS